jgi:hypothetical protein
MSSKKPMMFLKPREKMYRQIKSKVTVINIFFETERSMLFTAGTSVLFF